MNALPSAGGAAPLCVHGLGKSFGAHAVLDGVSFELAAGTVTGLLGPNGAGKSTLINLVLGLLRPDHGTASIFGMPAGSDAARQCHGVMLQDVELPPLLQVRELVTLFRKGYAAPMDELEVYRITGLQDLRAKRYGSLSGGEKRRVQCALALCGNPALLLLDEPTAHMDAASKEMFWNAVVGMRRKGCCVVVVSHQRDEIHALADRLLLIAKGRIVSHTAADGDDGAARGSRVSFVASAGMSLDALRALPGVRDLRQVGRITEAAVTDVAPFIAALGEMGVNMTSISISPILPDAAVPPAQAFERNRAHQ